MIWSPDLVAPLHSVRRTAWCAMSSSGIIEPFWFENDAGEAVTVNAQRYRQVLAKFWTALKRRLVGGRQLLDQQWFQVPTRWSLGAHGRCDARMAAEPIRFAGHLTQRGADLAPALSESDPT